MGFNKRFISENLTVKHLEENTLSKLYDKVDSFIFLDKISSFVREMYLQGLSNSEIINKIEETKTK